MDTSMLFLLLLAAGWGIVMTIILAWQVTRQEIGERSAQEHRTPDPPARTARPETAQKKLAG